MVNNIELDNNFDNDIMYYLSDYCDKYNIDDIRNESQNVWSGAMSYIGKRAFASYISENGTSALTHKVNSIFLYNISSYYIELCNTYDKVISIIDFSKLILVPYQTIGQWKNIDKSTLQPVNIPYIPLDICMNYILPKDIHILDRYNIDYINSFIHNNNLKDIKIIVNDSNIIDNDISVYNKDDNNINIYRYSILCADAVHSLLCETFNEIREHGLSNNLISGKRNPLGTIAVLNRQYNWNSDNNDNNDLRIEQKANKQSIMNKYKGLIE